MNKLNVSLSIVLLSYSMFSIGSDYVDPIQKDIDVKQEKVISDLESKCGKPTLGCKMDAESTAQEMIPSRGTNKYAKKAYGSLSVPQAKVKLKELVKLYDSISDQRSGTWQGKITKENVEQETRWIMINKLNQSAPDIFTAKMYLNMPL